MEVKKIENYFNLALDNVNFFLENEELAQSSTAYILTDSFKNAKLDEDNFFNLNRDKIFAAPGEYNLGSVYFWGLLNANRIAFLFEAEEGSLLYWQNRLLPETVKSIKAIKKEIDSFFNLNNDLDEEIIKIFKPRLIITNKEPKGIKNKQTGYSLKINLKKVNDLIFVLK